jgi:hypothetical protein
LKTLDSKGGRGKEGKAAGKKKTHPHTAVGHTNNDRLWSCSNPAAPLLSLPASLCVNLTPSVLGHPRGNNTRVPPPEAGVGSGEPGSVQLAGGHRWPGGHQHSKLPGSPQGLRDPSKKKPGIVSVSPPPGKLVKGQLSGRGACEDN